MTLGGVDQSIHSHPTNKIEYAVMKKSNSWFQVNFGINFFYNLFCFVV